MPGTSNKDIGTFPEYENFVKHDDFKHAERIMYEDRRTMSFTEHD